MFYIYRKDISIDSPSREEDVARVLSRLGLHTFKFKVGSEYTQ